MTGPVMRYAVTVFLFIVFTCLLLGCGGGGGGTLPPPMVVPHLVLGWGARSRATGNLNSALSAVVQLHGAKPDGSDLVLTVNRKAGSAAYTETVNGTEPVRTGSWLLTVTFFADINGTEATVGTAQATVKLSSDGALPDVDVTGQIKKLTLRSQDVIAVVWEPALSLCHSPKAVTRAA